MQNEIMKQAEQIVEAAGQGGGSQEIRRLALRGWPHNRPLENDSFELRCAIQDEAKRIEASLDLDAEQDSEHDAAADQSGQVD